MADRAVRYVDSIVGVSQIPAVVEELVTVIDVRGLYIYGSAVTGGLQPDSDIDLLLVTRSRLVHADRVRLLHFLTQVSGRRATRGPARPLDVTVIALDDVVPWRYPPVCDFLYGEWLRDEFADGSVPQPHASPDLAILLTSAREHAVAVLGPPLDQLVAPVPTADLRQAILDSLEPLLTGLIGDERNVLLTLARMVVTLESNEIVPKDVAAQQILPTLSEPSARLLEQAAAAYRGAGDDDWSPAAAVAGELASRIRDVPIIRVVAALTTDPHGRILLVRKQGSDRFMQPGGKPEAGEDAVGALRRELREELLIDVPAAQLRPLGSFVTDTANEPGHQLHSDVFALHLDAEVTAAAEIAEARWFTVDEAHALGDRLAPLARLLLARVADAPLRESVRALILDEQDNVLLVRFQFGAARFWANPGGGIEADEDRLTALQRELREEVGLDIETLGPEVWTKTAHFPMNAWDGQVDHIHLVRVPHFEPTPEFTDQQLRDEGVQELRWWSVDEIIHSTEVFAPRGIRDLLRDLQRQVPDGPISLTGF